MSTVTIKEALDAALQFHQRNELAQAESIYRQILAQQPNQPDALHLLGMIAFAVGRLDDALELMQRAIAADPSVAEYHSNAGVVLEALGRTTESLTSFARAVELDPNHAKALTHLSTALQAHGRMEDAIEYARRALAVAPNDPAAYNALGNAMIRQGRVEEALECYRQAIARDRKFSQAWSNLLLCLHYGPGHTPQQIFDEHLRWARQCAAAHTAGGRAFFNNRSPDRPLRIGYLSPDFNAHSISYFIEPLLDRHDRKRFEIFCYSDTRRPDAVTERLQSYSSTWRRTSRLSDDQLFEQIAQDQIDILVDLTGHAGPNRMLVLARQPAPIQVRFLGYPNTTGLSTVAYRFTDSIADPPPSPSPGIPGNGRGEGGFVSLHTEQLYRLDPCAWCYRPPPHAPDPAPTTDPHITFGCFNAQAKLTLPMVTRWAQILSQVPDSKLILKSVGLSESPNRDRVRDQFAAHGIPPDRLDLLPAAHDPAAHLRTYQRIDIALDTYPYHGTATTCEALWMSVPVVTLAGNAHVSRVGASLLHAVGLDDLIARSADEYVKIVTWLANDRERLTMLHTTLRQRMRASPLMNEHAYTRQIESAYRTMWRNWCAVAPAC